MCEQGLVTLYEARSGDTLMFKGKGLVFGIFNFLLCIFEKRWRQIPRELRPWHLGKVTSAQTDGLFVLEGTSPCCREHFYYFSELRGKACVARWLKTPIPKDRWEIYNKEFIGKKYDVPVYFWTMAQYLIRHYWNKCIPRLLDDRYTCWELVQSIDCDEGEPWGSKYDCVMITDFPLIYKLGV